MAIDSTLFAAQLPAQAYAAGDRIPMGVIRGPSVVRDGYGASYLKKIFTMTSAQTIEGHVEIKNSNWVDMVSNLCPNPSTVVLSSNSNGVQPGHDAPLTPNSGWDVVFVIDVAGTTTAAADVFALIDIDYPSVQAIADPRNAKGIPASNIRADTVNGTAPGSSNAMVWTTYNIDILKAGYRYLISSAAFKTAGGAIGFFSISGAAGQAGLERIIPVIPNNLGNLRYVLDYSTPLVKGPFNINYAIVGPTTPQTAVLEIDWVKK